MAILEKEVIKISKDKVEKVQKDFIKTLVDIQKNTLDVMKQRVSPPMGMLPFGNRDTPSKLKRKPSKKQLRALKDGRQKLLTKNISIKQGGLK